MEIEQGGAKNVHGWTMGPVLPLDAQRAHFQFMTHLVKSHRAGLPWPVDTFGEFGTGTSLGICFCALLAGAKRYCGFDLMPLVKLPEQRAVLDRIYQLFLNREPAKNDIGNPAIEFPRDIITDELLKRTLQKDFVEHLAQAKGDIIKYVAPYEGMLENYYDSIDFLMSTATMEHVDAPVYLYSEFKKMLKHGAIMSHSIDIRSHGYARPWNGQNLWNAHWMLNDREWSEVTNGQEFSINRLPASSHLKIIVEGGFKLMVVQKRKFKNELMWYNLASRFQWMTAEDIECSGLHVVSRKI